MPVTSKFYWPEEYVSEVSGMSASRLRRCRMGYIELGNGTIWYDVDDCRDLLGIEAPTWKDYMDE